MKRVFFAEDGVTVFNVGVIAEDAEPVEGTLDVPDNAFVGPGMVREGDAFVSPAVPEPVPHEVTNRQMRLALIAIGKFDDVDAIAQQMPQTAQVEWEYANHVYRDAPLIAGAGQMLGMTPEDVDDLFRLAATL